MFGLFKKRRRNTGRNVEIAPDEILLDSSNIPNYDTDQFEGRIEQPLPERSIWSIILLGLTVFVLLVFRVGNLQIVQGADYAQRASNNKLSKETIFADRGTITDRNGIVLATNRRLSVDEPFAQRTYTDFRGIAHTIGYIKEPAKDSSGAYFREASEGMDGVEKYFSQALSGRNGVLLSETDAHNKIVSSSVVENARAGEKLVLSIDAKVSEGLYDAIKHRVDESGFQAGAAVIIDVETGELLSMVSYPEYRSQSMTDGDRAAITLLNADSRQPYLNRTVNGLYAPGSIVKPIVAIAALAEGVIDEHTEILSTGSITVPNPYDPSKPSVYKDWKAHGWVDMRKAIANSSDVYFYEVGGGFGSQKGIGIQALERYFRLFGFGATTGLYGYDEPEGSIPSPEWKEKNFPGDPWRVGNTYHTAIGQYGTTLTPLQAVRAIAAVANGGKLLTPTLVASSTPQFTMIDLDQHYFKVAQEGMRQGVLEGTGVAIKNDWLPAASKTGTAQVGSKNQYMNSWIVGFYPYDTPRYAFAVVLEKAPAGTLMGAPAAMSEFFTWLRDYKSQ